MNNFGNLLNWISFNFKIDLDRINFESEYGHYSRGYVLSCPKGTIIIDEDDMSSSFTRRLKRGYITKQYYAFEAGLEKGEKPSRSHFILRHFYNKGLKAKNKKKNK